MEIRSKDSTVISSFQRSPAQPPKYRDGPQADFATDDNVWQFSSKEKFSEGPLQIIVEKAQVHYRLFSEPPLPSENEIQQILDEYSFIFDVGKNPQIGEKWMLDKQFEFGEYKGKVTSVQAVKVAPQQLPQQIKFKEIFV